MSIQQQSLLSEQEIRNLAAQENWDGSYLDGLIPFARVTESAVIAKLAEQAGQFPEGLSHVSVDLLDEFRVYAAGLHVIYARAAAHRDALQAQIAKLTQVVELEVACSIPRDLDPKFSAGKVYVIRGAADPTDYEQMVPLSTAQAAVAAERVKTAAVQANLDALMLEHCPDEMTPEQFETWGKHQRPLSGEESEAISKALRRSATLIDSASPAPAAEPAGIAPGERRAGLVLDDDGKPSHHLILLPGQVRKRWADAKAWAASIGGELPTRREQSLLFANLGSEFEAGGYWSGEQYSEGSAWSQDFKDGGQGLNIKSLQRLASAVRRVPVLSPSPAVEPVRVSLGLSPLHRIEMKGAEFRAMSPEAQQKFIDIGKRVGNAMDEYRRQQADAVSKLPLVPLASAPSPAVPVDRAGLVAECKRLLGASCGAWRVTGSDEAAIAVAEEVQLRALAAIDRLASAPAQASAGLIEHIAVQWDGCVYQADCDIDIGEAIRTAARRFMAAAPAAGGEKS